MNANTNDPRPAFAALSVAEQAMVHHLDNLRERWAAAASGAARNPTSVRARELARIAGGALIVAAVEAREAGLPAAYYSTTVHGALPPDPLSALDRLEALENALREAVATRRAAWLALCEAERLAETTPEVLAKVMREYEEAARRSSAAAVAVAAHARSMGR